MQDDGVEDGVGTETLSRRGESELGVESGFRCAKDGVVDAAEQGVSHVFRPDGVEIGVAKHLDGIRVKHIDIVVVVDKVVPDSVRGFLAGEKA